MTIKINWPSFATLRQTPTQRWVVTQPNGKTFLVFDEKKVKIALSCGYTVEELRYGKQEPSKE